MQPPVAEFLKLPILAVNSFYIVVGNEASIKCEKSCSDVPVLISEQVFSIPLPILPIHG